MQIRIPIKFTDIELDQFLDEFYALYRRNPKEKFVFDLTDVEFIANQELLVLSGLFKSLFDANVEFEIQFLKKGVSTANVSDRVKRQIIQFWKVWKIWQIVPLEKYEKYFGLDGNTIERLQESIGYYPKSSEIYTRYGITPFVSLDRVNNYNETEIQNSIAPIYTLNNATEQLLKNSRCYHPFTSKSLSTIITEELYLNFLDHAQKSSFENFIPTAFMSISFQDKIDEKLVTTTEIQKRKALNFKTECLPESAGFFKSKGIFKNFPFLQFSFLDFGPGIVETLRGSYLNSLVTPRLIVKDNEVLAYAFRHDTSRHPIFENDNDSMNSIPRGLFDAITIVRRYNGLLVVRSNTGKLLFDFSTTSNMDSALKYFGNENFNFPGTLISIYLPAIEDQSKISTSAIKPDIQFTKIRPEKRKYVSVKLLLDETKSDKENLYTQLLKNLKRKIIDKDSNTLTFISFLGCENVEKRLIKKILYFLLTNYDINFRNNVIVVRSPDNSIINEVRTELEFLTDAIKNYKIHPLPLIDFKEEESDIEIDWLGVFNKEDKQKLENIIFEGYVLRKSEFSDPSNVIGQLNNFDAFGNLETSIPTLHELVSFFKEERDILNGIIIKELLDKHSCVKRDDGKSLYLCNGNYYQREYVDLNNLIHSKQDCILLCELLFSKIQNTIKDVHSYRFIGITSASHKIIKILEYLGLIELDNYIALDNYHSFEIDIENENIQAGEKFILIGDVAATSFLTWRLDSKLKSFGAEISYAAVLVSVYDEKFVSDINELSNYNSRIISLYHHPITKYKRESVIKEIGSKSLIRINPHTNIPITLSIKETGFNESVIFPTKIRFENKTNEIVIKNQFLDSISEHNIKIGFLRFNNLIHPYFFDTDRILQDIATDTIISIIEKINNPKLSEEDVKVFYPRKSGVAQFDFSKLKSALKNHTLEEFEIERFGTAEGWRFPHNSDYLTSKVENHICFILDDGSCSGNSLIQIVDEISFYKAKEIVLLSFIGRVEDHKREFFSRVSTIKVKDHESIPISIYFVSHWHIPTYYLDENPNVSETNWLKDVLRIQNLPNSIKLIVNRIVSLISPKTKELLHDYKYLPKEKGTTTIPKKDLLLVREEVGKIIGFRLYKESFKYFDYFI